ncbi:MAG: V-type ATP synthase subunit D [Candidatus Omnitrophica bacterium]|nr:V-type ATP synthase subunit D [Candidatus Omnitrophota bacterium]
MAKIKLTKGELKRQRDALKQYERYLPTLQLKKQQIQFEILRQAVTLEEKERAEMTKRDAAKVWAGLLTDKSVDVKPMIVPAGIITDSRNIAGVDIPVFVSAEFEPAEYDLFVAPLWVDSAVEALRTIISVREEISVIRKGLAILRHELRITTQRVNLFEKVKIPEASEAIRLIKIYIGDQMANAVGRSKMAKRKIERNEVTV